jgi:hypothetical protein
MNHLTQIILRTMNWVGEPQGDRHTVMKFSIRDLLLVTMIVALGLGWWVDRATLGKRIRMLEKRPDLSGLERMAASPVPNAYAPAPNPPKR